MSRHPAGDTMAFQTCHSILGLLRGLSNRDLDVTVPYGARNGGLRIDIHQEIGSWEGICQC